VSVIARHSFGAIAGGVVRLYPGLKNRILWVAREQASISEKPGLDTAVLHDGTQNDRTGEFEFLIGESTNRIPNFLLSVFRRFVVRIEANDEVIETVRFLEFGNSFLQGFVEQSWVTFPTDEKPVIPIRVQIRMDAGMGR